MTDSCMYSHVHLAVSWYHFFKKNCPVNFHVRATAMSALFFLEVIMRRMTRAGSPSGSDKWV